MGRVFSLLMLASLTLAAAGCEQQSQGQPSPVARVESLEGRLGRGCTVHFRRNVLGVEREKPFSIDVNGFSDEGGTNRADITVSGKLLGSDDNWLILKTAEGHETWVPRGNILMLQFPPGS